MKYILEKFSKGVRIRKMSDSNTFDNDISRKSPQARTSIKGFSDKSSARLRDLLLESCCDYGSPFGFTCTIPEATPFQWRRIMNRFGNRLVRDGLCCIWRVELQKRGTPHLHCIGFAKDIIDVGKYWNNWVCSSDYCFASRNPWFLVYGFCARWLSRDAWLVYMCCHSTKHKKSQLGWLGRQWGVINRKMIYRELPQVYEFLDSSKVRQTVFDATGYDFDDAFPGSSIVRFGTEEIFSEIQKKPLDSFYDVW